MPEESALNQFMLPDESVFLNKRGGGEDGVGRSEDCDYLRQTKGVARHTKQTQRCMTSGASIMKVPQVGG